jgi:hypothetical protein
VSKRLQSIPSDRLSCGRDAIVAMLERDPAKLRVAAAFVTVGGVETLVDVLGDWSGELELVARGMPITQPEALEQLEQLDASVSAVIGQRANGFHPKLWLSEGPAAVEVLSGSGNLTEEIGHVAVTSRSAARLAERGRCVRVELHGRHHT